MITPSTINRIRRAGLLKATKQTSLTLRTEEALRSKIADDAVKVGDKLPTERELALELGVSRTVIREAVAALRADGLIDAKHGIGYFVAQKSASDYGFPTSAKHLGFSSSMLDLLELRMAVEIHAAGLAAARRSWAQEAKIFANAENFATALERGESPDLADWAFHRSISEATNNAAFVEFFDRMGLSVLPRRAIEGEKRDALITRQYLEKSIPEHRAVCEAISRGDVEAAREAMKGHLGGSQIRYRGLVGTE
ncbi:FadR/GntR family transcriptional regulator [Paraburkholderia sp. RL17-337-BIB-A]|uniref:FadR/GntR family transcriptional regulator n=1 Tax=Paraburkholderia sp. RL17-337-BIB-A TaxID=3031636 RepID=UPI0038B6B8EE